MRIIFLFLATFLFANEQYLIAKFENIKPSYYNQQIVNLKLKIISAKNGDIEVVDDRNRTYKVIEKNGSYISNINFELNNTFPKFFVSLKDDDIILNTLKLSLNSKIRYLHPPKKFCGILANNLKITDKIMVNYDDTHNIVYWTETAINGDGSKFKLGLKNEKLYFLDKNNTTSSYSYSAIVPVNQKDFSFSYFNTKDDVYKAIRFHIEPKNESVSTQTDIKPMAKTNIYIISVTLGLLFLLWLLLYIYRKRIIYIILMIIVLAILIIINLPKKEIVLTKGDKIQLLPFPKSTIFLIVKHDMKVKVLNHKDGYKKIEFNKHIGWIKDE